MLLLGRLIIGGIIAAVAASAIVIYVKGVITPKKIREAMRTHDIGHGFVDMIDRCNNTMELNDFLSDKKIEFHGDGIDESLSNRKEIYV